MSKRLVFVVSSAAFFVSHRLPIALRAIDDGYEVHLVTGAPASQLMHYKATKQLAQHPIWLHEVAFSTGGVNPLREVPAIAQITRILRSLRPSIVHCVTPKGILYGGLCARLAKVPSIVIAVSGQGYAFTGHRYDPKRWVIRCLYVAAARLAYGHPRKRVIVQNEDDRRQVISFGWSKAEDILLIPGSGVRLEDFASASTSTRSPIVLLPARMLRDKGVAEFVEAARIIKATKPTWRFVLAGTADHENPTSISRTQLEEWHESGVIEWLGHVDNMTSLYASASIVCLPSYREGMPKVLLEAAAAGCPVVTTDTVGCREAIIPNQTGFLVRPRDSKALADALLKLIENEPLRNRLGASGRTLAERRYCIDSVVATTLNLYRELECTTI